MDAIALPSLDLSCPIPWPSHSHHTLPDYPLPPSPAEDAQQYVKRAYLETLWLPEELVALSSLVPTLRNIPASVVAPLLPNVFLSLDAIERKYRTTLPEFMRDGTGEGQGEQAMMWFADALRVHRRDADEMEQEDEDQRRKAWLEELERREVQIQVLLRLFFISLPVAIPSSSPSPRKRKRGRPVQSLIETTQQELEMLIDRLCIWHALESVLDDEPLSAASREERGWVQAWEEDVVRPLFTDTPAMPFVVGFHEKLNPTLSPPSSPESSPPASPRPLPAVLPLPIPDNASSLGVNSRSTSVSSISFGNGFRRSASVSSTGGEGRRSVGVTRTGVNNNKGWAGKEVKMSRRAVGGGKPQSRQASAPPLPPPPLPSGRSMKRAESQMLVMATPVKKASLPSQGTGSSLDEVMETPQVKARGV